MRIVRSIRYAIACGVACVVAAFGPGCSNDETFPLPSLGDASTDGGLLPTPDASHDAAVDAPVADATADAPGQDAATDAGTPGVLLVGTVVSPENAFDGEVLVEGDTITCVQPGSACESRPGAAGARRVDTNGIIAPGLIDAHNHILFDIFDGTDWLPSKTYTNHNQWTGEARYAAMLDVKQCMAGDAQGKPAWCPSQYAGTGSLRCEMDKWGELKGLVAGTTSIVGLPGTSGACFASLARSVDGAENDLGVDTVQTSATFPPSKSSADGVCANFASGKTKAYLIHCGEGTDSTALAEFTTLSTVTTTPGCLLAPQTAITHGTAFGAGELAAMAQSGTKLVWSPASNVALYGATTDIPAALDAGVLVALAPDWSMGGSPNLLDEMRFADAWDAAHWNDRLSTRDLVIMATRNAAKALAYDDRIGALEEGKLADIAVFAGDRTKPYDAIVAASPKDVELTMVGGVALYGDLQNEGIAPALPGCEHVAVCGATKFVCVAEASSTDKLDQTLATIESTLQAGLSNADALSGTGYTFAPLAPLTDCP